MKFARSSSDALSGAILERPRTAYQEMQICSPSCPLVAVLPRAGGFTLIELIVIIVVLAILSGIAIPKYIDYTANAKSSVAKATLSGSVRSAVSNFYANLRGSTGTATFPTLVQVQTVGTVMQEALPPNPYNLSATISAGSWTTNAPITGTNGYNYDRRRRPLLAKQQHEQLGREPLVGRPRSLGPSMGPGMRCPPHSYPYRPLRNRARSFRRGFSMIEVIAVIVIVGIVGAAAIGSMNKSRQNRQRAGSRALAAGVAYARERAMTLARPTWVYFYTDTETATYAETVGGAVVPIANPATGAQLSTVLGSASDNAQFAEVGIGTVNGGTSGSAIVLGFDWQGRPTDSGGMLLTSDWAITITQSGQTEITLTISHETGLGTIAW